MAPTDDETADEPDGAGRAHAMGRSDGEDGSGRRGSGFAIGLVPGVALGAALDDVAVGLAIGAAFEAARGR